MDRSQKLLHGVEAIASGLEIGPGCSPLVAGRPGFNVRVLDHAPRHELVEKFKVYGEDTTCLPEVDYVWDGRPYLDLVGDQRFDYIVASHVIEHVPDLIGFLNNCSSVLNPGGVLALAVPDRRLTFDYYRPRSSLARVVDAHLQGRTRPSPGDMVEHVQFMARSDGAQTWSAGPVNPDFVHSSDYAIEEFKRVLDGAYVDMHVWIFSQTSFRWMIEDLHALHFIDLREKTFFARDGYEFFIQLSREGSGPNLSRQDLAAQALAESRFADG